MNDNSLPISALLLKLPSLSFVTMKLCVLGLGHWPTKVRPSQGFSRQDRLRNSLIWREISQKKNYASVLSSGLNGCWVGHSHSKIARGVEQQFSTSMPQKCLKHVIPDCQAGPLTSLRVSDKKVTMANATIANQCKCPVWNHKSISHIIELQLTGHAA